VADSATKRLAWDLTLDRLRRAREAFPDLIVMSGAAEGFDLCLARAALHLGMRLWLALPNRGYLAHYYGRASLTGRDRSAEAQALLGSADRITNVMEQVHHTTELKLGGKHANFWRNDFMVQAADAFLVWDPTSKGTAHCLAEIKEAALPYEVLSPEPATLPL
jgi:hypothetical protein